MSGKGMRPQMGYNREKFDAGYSGIDWGKGKTEKRKTKNVDLSKEANKPKDKLYEDKQRKGI